MSSNKVGKYEELYNVTLAGFYNFVTDVMVDFNFSMHRAIREVEAKRRLELWVYGADREQEALVWVEVLKPGDSLDPFLTTDVLRSMNDEEVTRLFFFTNGNLSEEDKEILEGNNHFIFTTDEIVETLLAIEERKAVRVTRKRQVVKVPSAVVLIKNYFKSNQIRKKQVFLKVSAVPDLLAQYTRLIRRILVEVDKVSDINDIPSPVKEKLKKIQFDLLPELAKTPSYVFPKQFGYLREALFNLINVSIIYIGNFINYESEDDLKKNREAIEELLKQIEDVDNKIASYKEYLLFQSEKSSVKLIITSGVIMIACVILLMILKIVR